MRHSEHLSLLISVVIWGTLHPISKLLLQAGLTPTQIALSRLGLAALTMLAVGVASRRLWRLTKLPARELLAIAALGVCGYFLSMYLSLQGLRFLPAAVNSLLANTAPLFVALLSPLLLRERLTRRAVLGLAAGFAGVVVLAQSRGGAEGEIAPQGVLLALGGGATFGLYTVLGRWSTARLDPVLVTLVSCVASLVPLSVLALLDGSQQSALDASLPVLAGLLWLGVVATGITFLIWTAALRRLRAASVSAYSYLIPVFGVLFAFLLLGEQPTPLFVLGGLLVLGGVIVAQR